MTVAELIAKLQEMPQDVNVAIREPESSLFEAVQDVGTVAAVKLPSWPDRLFGDPKWEQGEGVVPVGDLVLISPSPVD
jgi:hypothetical protein